MKKALLINALAFILFTLPVTAQIEEKSKSKTDSIQIMVIKQRQMIVDKLKEKDFLKIREIYQSLENKTLTHENSPFDYTEYLYLNLLMGDWHTLTDFMKDYNESENIVPFLVNDQLKDVLIERVVESSDSILINIQNAPLDEDGKSVIQLFTQLTKNDEPDYQYYFALDQHNEKFKESPYNDFVDNYLPEPKIKYTQNGFNSAFSFSLGSGMVFPDGKLEESFSQRQSFYASIDANYKRLFGSFNFQAAGLKLKTPFILNTADGPISYPVDDIFNYQDIGLKVGYFLLRSNRFHIGPYGTINNIVIKTTDFDLFERLLQKTENDENSEYNIVDSFSCGPGFQTEVKLSENHKVNKNSETIDSYVSLKAEAGYNIIMSGKNKYFKGNTSYFTVAIVFGFGTF